MNKSFIKGGFSMPYKDYIGRFNIDINGVSTPEEVSNELSDKVFYQLGFEPVFSPMDLEKLELRDPKEWNRITSSLEEIELRIAMDCYFEERELLEKDINKNIGLIMDLINYVQS